jgi:hypothetical protein
VKIIIPKYHAVKPSFFNQKHWSSHSLAISNASQSTLKLLSASGSLHFKILVVATNYFSMPGKSLQVYISLWVTSKIAAA